MHKPGRKEAFLIARITKDQKEALVALAKARAATLSEVIREIIIKAINGQN